MTNHDKSDLPGNLSVSESSNESKEFGRNSSTGLRLNIRQRLRSCMTQSGELS